MSFRVDQWVAWGDPGRNNYGIIKSIIGDRAVVECGAHQDTMELPMSWLRESKDSNGISYYPKKDE